jgi:hypothetical protein
MMAIEIAALLALVPVKLRGQQSSGATVRIDDPRPARMAGGLWSTTSTRAPFHMEGGKGAKPKVVKFQLRPDPLAK